MMEILDSPLTLTKLLIPPQTWRILKRSHLDHIIDPIAPTGLTLVCGPAGYGKTTLMTAWSQALLDRGGNVAWYALDTGDNEPVIFAAYLVAGFLRTFGPLPALSKLAQRLRSSPEVDLRQLIPRLVNIILVDGRSCALILDDFHLIKRPEIHTAIAELINNMPPNLAVIIGSRSNLPFSIGRLRARGCLHEVRIGDLRFRNEECLQFLNEIMHLELSQSSVKTLETRTEGWAAALQLAALALATRNDRETLLQSEDFLASFSGSHRFLVDYLLEEVIDRLPEDVQWFLLATSILDRFCPPLCDVILNQDNRVFQSSSGSQSSAQIIQQLIKSSLFIITLDDQSQWYRYHHLFQEFLAAQLKKAMPGTIPSLHRVACEWLAENQYLREAASHAFAVGDWEYAAAFVEKHSFTLLMHSDISTIYEWCSAFPEQIMAAHPALCIHECWALGLSFRKQYRERIEFRLGQVDAALRKLKGISDASDLQETSGIIRVFLTMIPDPISDPREQLINSQRLLETYPDGDPGQFAFLWTSVYAYLALNAPVDARSALKSALISAQTGHLYFGIVESAFHLALLDYTQGYLELALESCARTRHDLTTLLPNLERELPAVGALDIATGVVLLEMGRLDEAEKSLHHGIDLVSQGTNPYYLLIGYTALFNILTHQNRDLEASVALEQLELVWPDIDFLTHGLRQLEQIRQHPQDPQIVAESTEWVQKFPVDQFATLPGMGPFAAAEAYYRSFLIWIRVQTHLGCQEKTGKILDDLLQPAIKNDLYTRMIELSLLEAEIAAIAGNTQQMDIAIERVIKVGADRHFLQIFRQNPESIPILFDFASRHPTVSKITRILEGINPLLDRGQKGRTHFSEPIQTSPPPSTMPSLPESLTRREIEILGLISCGCSNQEIANKLTLTVGTVKSHINHILRKLDSPSRTAALARARELGFIEK